MDFNTTTKKPILTTEHIIDDAPPVDLKASGNAQASRSLADNKRRQQNG